jgi:predicted RNA-binding protein with TRAM domain
LSEEGSGEPQASPREPFGLLPKPVKTGEELTLDITDVSRRGDGVAKVKGFVVFVPNTKVGDKVKVRITFVGPRFATAEVI